MVGIDADDVGTDPTITLEGVHGGRVSVLGDLILIQSFLDFFIHVMNHLFYCWVK